MDKTNGTTEGLTIEQVERAQDLKFRLEDGTERLNTVIERCNEMMRSMNLGIAAEVPIGDGKWMLAWKRLYYGRNNDTMLVVFQVGDQAIVESSTVPLANTIRSRRVQALYEIPKLWNKILDGAEARSAELEKSIATLEVFMQEWESKNGNQ